MRFLHISDLHLGKRIFEFSMLEDQKYILNEISGIAKSLSADAVLIAGDVYDKSVPTAEAVAVFDNFLNMLTDLGIKVFIISGNHDSMERLQFGAKLMQPSGVYINAVFSGVPSPIVLHDEYGEINLYLLPFIKPAHVKAAIEGCEPQTTDEAVREIVGMMNINTDKRNILVAHQFAAGSSVCDSEELSAGGSTGVGADVFAQFDYTALGHLHSPQKVISDNIRYSGSPLKYSFSETSHVKSVVMVDIRSKGDINITLHPLSPMRDMRKIQGSYNDVTLLENYKHQNTSDYVHITLTDEEDIPNAISKLRSIYPNIMSLSYDNKRTRENKSMEIYNDDEISPTELIEAFYYQQNNQRLSDYQAEIVKSLLPD